MPGTLRRALSRPGPSFGHKKRGLVAATLWTRFAAGGTASVSRHRRPFDDTKNEIE